MKIKVLSDLHLEMCRYQPHSSDDVADVIVLAGDIWTRDHGIFWARATWPDKEIIYVSGNHEYYGRNRLEVAAMQRIAAKESGVHLLENDEVVINGVRFLGCTLWTDFGLMGEEGKPWCMRAGQRALNDFRVIFEGNEHFTPMDSVKLHEASVTWLEMKLQHEPFDGKTVVVTHHLPSLKSVADRFVDDELSACFASHLDQLLVLSDFWIHGHTHDTCDYRVGATRVVCNPRGYQRYLEGGIENMDFDPSFILEV